MFATLLLQKAYIISRWQFGTGVLTRDGQEFDLLVWLNQQAKSLISEPILLGKKERLACRLIAWRLPPEQANRRRQKLRREIRDRRGQEPCAERLAWCDWTVLVTTVPEELLSEREAIVLYRARWQIELLFKRWKSQGLADALTGSGDVRKMVRIWSRLLAALVQHWLLAGSLWNDPRRSLSKACEVVRRFVGLLLAHLDHRKQLLETLTRLRNIAAHTCRRNQRSKLGTFDLLNDVNRLDFCLT